MGIKIIHYEFHWIGERWVWTTERQDKDEKDFSYAAEFGFYLLDDKEPLNENAYSKYQ